jgi:hypothetical protein
MIELNYNIWSHSVSDIILRDIAERSPNRINIFAAEEHEINRNWSITQCEPYKTIFKENNIEVNFVFGSADMSFYNENYHFPTDNINTYLWPHYHMYRSFNELYDHRYFLNQNKLNLKFTIPFISMNNRSHTHRKILMDNLEKYNLINYGAVSWHNDNDISYDWNYWKNNHRLVLSGDYQKNFNNFIIPLEWNDSFMNLVSESTIDKIFFTEKTWTPLFLQKLFLVQSAPHFYKVFQEMGFLIYDEIFDYSFDNILDINERTDAIVQNVKNIIGKDYEQLYNISKLKLEYNFNHAIKIISSDNNIIPIVKNSEFAMKQYNLEYIKSIALPFLKNN